jgi:glycosyltransferase involved in cell wall biosynthesis
VRILVFTWRDAGHPEAGGSETFVERVSAGLVAMGHDVTIFTAGYPGAPVTQDRDGRLYLRRGGRYSVYARAAAYLVRHGRSYDAIVDIQNGVPFWAPLWTRTRVVNVVHHVHREQWPEVFGPVRARLGWWLESSAAPKVYRGCHYVTVSEATRAELSQMGVSPARVHVVYSGNDLPDPAVTIGVPRTVDPSMVVLGRLVPHKRVELAIDAVARLRADHPGLRLTVVGQGYWEDALRRHARDVGVAEAVEFTGFVDEDAKHRLLARSWVALLPSLKEGWGLAVLEAGVHGTPTVAFRSAGGTVESVLEDETGLLADGDEEFVQLVGRLLDEEDLRRTLGKSAADHARMFSWDRTAREVADVLGASAAVAHAPVEQLPSDDRAPTVRSSRT